MKTAVAVLSGAAVFFALVLGGDFGDTIGAPGGIGIQTQAPPPSHHHQSGPPKGGKRTHHGGHGGPTPGQSVPEPSTTEQGPEPSPTTPTVAPSPPPKAVPAKHHRTTKKARSPKAELHGKQVPNGGKKNTHAEHVNAEKGPQKHEKGGDHEGRRGKDHGSGHGDSKHGRDHGHGSCSKDQEDGHGCGHGHGEKD